MLARVERGIDMSSTRSTMWNSGMVADIVEDNVMFEDERPDTIACMLAARYLEQHGYQANMDKDSSDYDELVRMTIDLYDAFAWVCNSEKSAIEIRLVHTPEAAHYEVTNPERD